MLKKSLHIAMALLLMISITGLTIHKHYCGDELTNISIFVNTSDCQENSCAHCEDETLICKIDVDLFSANTQELPENTSFEIEVIITPQSTLLIEPLPVQSAQSLVNKPFQTGLHGIAMLQSFRC